MAKITITISDVKDSNVIEWLERLRPLKNNIEIEQTGYDKGLLEFLEKHKNILPEINHSPDPALIAINIGHFREVLIKNKRKTISNFYLKKLFNENIGTGCLGYKNVRSKLKNIVMHCWVFENPFRGVTCE